MNYHFDDIEKILKGKVLHRGIDSPIRNVIYDTRKISFASHSIFFAFKGSINDGHEYIEDAYEKGVRHFVVSKKINAAVFPEANIIQVNSSLQALQNLARHHRKQFKTKIIAITGSNGKTVIKEWLGKALSRKYKLVKSPKSYNSQIGVALSLLQIDSQDEIAVIEAGISKKHEMRFLERMIKPDIGIFTNLGDAHSSGFSSRKEKLEEKIILFKSSNTIICSKDHAEVYSKLNETYPSKLLSWSRNEGAELWLKNTKVVEEKNVLSLFYKERAYTIECQQMSREFIENLMHVISCLLLLGFDQDELQAAVDQMDQVQNRLELREGINSNLLINDSYSLDMASLQLALEFQDLHAKGLEKALIFSDFDQQVNKLELFTEVAKLIREKKLRTVFAIGIDNQYKDLFAGIEISFFTNPSELLTKLELFTLRSHCILIKGARRFHLENIFHKLSKQVHETVLETSFSALDHNLNIYKSYLRDDTKIMAVIKADAYGSGSVRMAQYLEQKSIDYLAVAIIDEAVQIREAGCQLPIMVFNVHLDQIDLLWEYGLEPEVYSLDLLNKLEQHADRIQKPLSIHIKLDTGMHRLGFMESDIDPLLDTISSNPLLVIKSVFSHLSASEDPRFDDFTNQQCARFQALYAKIEKSINYSFHKHILNTGGILRFGKFQEDMVRIGLGLYGIDETGLIADKLEKVHRLKARILQVKTLKAGESTSYGRSGMVDKETKIAVVSIGYADGLMRICSKNGYQLKVRDQLCPILGNICMDICMIDVSHIDTVQEGDEVVIFDKERPLEGLAQACQTISYEIISRIASRVKRSYTYD